MNQLNNLPSVEGSMKLSQLNDAYRFSDLWTAELLAETRGQLIFVSDEGRWYLYNQDHWIPDNGKTQTPQRAAQILKTLLHSKAIRESDNDRASKIYRHLSQSISTRKIRDVLIMAAGMPELAYQSEQLDADPLLYNCTNGVLNLKTRELTQHGSFINHGADLLITTRPRIKYDPEAECPLFREFLREIFDNDHELVQYIKRCFGYYLTGRTEHQFGWFWYGHGANGKSTLMKILLALAGDYGGTIKNSILMRNRRQSGGSANPEVVELRNKRIIATDELPEGARIDEPTFKSLTGEDQLVGRFLFSNQILRFYPRFKMILVGNHKPEFEAIDEAVARRIRLIPFERVFRKHEQKYNLSNQLMTELPGILNWAMEGLDDLDSNGDFREPDRVLASTRKYINEQDALAQFIDERCVTGPVNSIKSSILHAAYMNYARQHGLKELSSNAFAARMDAKGFKKERKSNGVFYSGIEILEY